jgi:hypothetical protein
MTDHPTSQQNLTVSAPFYNAFPHFARDSSNPLQIEMQL